MSVEDIPRIAKLHFITVEHCVLWTVTKGETNIDNALYPQEIKLTKSAFTL